MARAPWPARLAIEWHSDRAKLCALCGFIDFDFPLCENPRSRPSERRFGRQQRTRELSFRADPSQSVVREFLDENQRPEKERRAGSCAIALREAWPSAEAVLNAAILWSAVILAVVATFTDIRWRRIPNWATVPGFFLGLTLNVAHGGWAGLKTSVLGAGLGLLLLFPFVVLRSLGAGDWKLAGAVGSLLGPGTLTDLLLMSVFVAGLMAIALVIYKRRVWETMRNLKSLVGSLATFRMPGPEVSLDNPSSLKVPYGVALGITVVLYGIFRSWGTA